MSGEYAALVHGEAIPQGRVDAFLNAGPATPPRGAGNCATSPNGAAHDQRPVAALPAERTARDERQRRRWATQVVVTDELARQACTERGLEPPDEQRPLTAPPAERTVADLGSIVAAALAHSPAARLLLTELEREQHVPETAVRDYYDHNRDRFLSPDALRRGVDPFGATTTPTDFLPYEHAREGIMRELRRAAGRRAFFDWLDRARTGVVYAPGHEHPGDPSHQDHEHRH